MSYLSPCLYFPIADCPCCSEVIFMNALQDNLYWQKAVNVLGMMLYFLHPPIPDREVIHHDWEG